MSKLEKITLRNVLCAENEEKTLTVEIVPFNRRNDDHVEFAFAYSDFLGRLPSPFSSMTDAAVRAVEVFMAHKEADVTDVKSDFYAVRNDKRAARTLLNTPSLQQALLDFFANA